MQSVGLLLRDAGKQLQTGKNPALFYGVLRATAVSNDNDNNDNHHHKYNNNKF